ncbi:MAG: FAD/NAD(P)-binding oxidoreductase [Actinomycetota bacterium]|nr:FAD/NAD(P)-binding oxidoreductase [Actinomycetota bacterium]
MMRSKAFDVPHRIVILGAGTGGTLVANRLRRLYQRKEASITVVDQDDRHVYQPGLLFVPFGLTHPEDIVRPRHRQLGGGIDFRQVPIERLDLDGSIVHLADGTSLGYDVLVIATGSRLQPEETDGLTGAGWMERVFTFYSPEGAAALGAALARFERGRLVVNIVDLPIKCPVAPLEFCFLADWYFHERGIRDQVQISFVTPLDGAFTKPVASKALATMLAEKDIELVTEFNTGKVDGANGKLISYDDREVTFDLAVVVPLHGGASYLTSAVGLVDELGFVLTDEHTLQSEARPNVFAIGDAAGVPISKAGSVTHFEGEALVENVRRFLDGKPLDASYDGHANCFIETGFSNALLIDFSYDVEPLQGHYPSSLGLPLLKESHLNHLGKLMFQWFYWHILLPGRQVPGISSAMPRAGKKDLPAPAVEGATKQQVATVDRG